jgi:hypothetical protein
MSDTALVTSVLTRRQLIRRGGAVAGAVWLGTSATATATTSTGLTPARRAAFAALAETVFTGPAYRLPASAAAPATADFATAYAAWPAADRHRADQVLDQIARLDRRGRQRAVSPPGIERRETELAERALALVAVTTAAGDGAGIPVVTS